MTNDEIAERIIREFMFDAAAMRMFNIYNIKPIIVLALDEKDEEKENE